MTCCQLRLGSLFDLKRLFNGLEDGGFQAWLSSVRSIATLTGYCKFFAILNTASVVWLRGRLDKQKKQTHARNFAGSLIASARSLRNIAARAPSAAR
jgi:hypothetical protein